MTKGRTVHLYDTLTYQLDPNILQFLGLFDRWRPLIAGLKRPPSSPERPKRRKISCHIKAMASGSAVREDHPFEEVRAPVRGTVAIDMEGTAFGLVMSRLPLIRWLVVKGVCDYADRGKNDVYHDYAARASALYALSFIQAYVTNERLPRLDRSSPQSRDVSPEIFKVLETIPGIIDFFSKKIEAARENRWEQVLEGLALLAELTAKHIDAINLVVAPIVENNDLVSTFQNYRALVNKVDFPIGYGTARGILEGAYGGKEFKKEPTHQKLKDVLLKLHKFQYIAFLLKRSSWRMADEFEKAEELWSLLSGKNSSRASSETTGLRNVVSQAFKSDMKYMSSPELPDDHKLDTPDEVVELVRTWCKEWQRSCQQTLYGGRGLHYAIGQLKVERYA